MSIILLSAIVAAAVVQTAGQLFEIDTFATANTTHCTAIKDASYYLSLSDQELFDIAINSTIGTCRIGRGGPDAFCDLYVVNATGGVPLNTAGLGTGCVASPDIGPKFQSVCFFQGAEYDLTMDWRDAMCTDMGVANAAAQLRYGIIEGCCGDLPNMTMTCEFGGSSDEPGHDDDCPDLPTCPKKKIKKICKCCRRICRKYDADKPCLECYKYCKTCEKLCGESIYQ